MFYSLETGLCGLWTTPSLSSLQKKVPHCNQRTNRNGRISNKPSLHIIISCDYQWLYMIWKIFHPFPKVFWFVKEAAKMDEQGIEPWTSRMRSGRSTTELHAQVMIAIATRPRKHVSDTLPPWRDVNFSFTLSCHRNQVNEAFTCVRVIRREKCPGIT